MGAVASYVSPPSSSSSPSRGGASATHLAVRPSVQCSGIWSRDLDRAARLGDMKKDQLRFKRTFASSKFHTSSNFFPACYWIRMKRSRTGKKMYHGISLTKLGRMIDIFLLLSYLLPSIVSVHCLSRKILMRASFPRFENSVCWWIIHTSWQACLPDVFSPPTVISGTFPPAFRLSRLATCLLCWLCCGRRRRLASFARFPPTSSPREELHSPHTSPPPSLSSVTPSPALAAVR